jgi:hypothetical protein
MTTESNRALAEGLTEATMMFLDCPAYLNRDGIVRCGLPAEVSCRFTMRSTDGPIECATIRCPAGHWFNGSIESLTWDRTDHHDPGTAGLSSRAERDSLQRRHGGRDSGGGSAPRDFPAEPERSGRGPNGAPAYYLGHPATLWITAMRPHRGGTAPAAGPKPPSPAATQPGTPACSSTADSRLSAPGHGTPAAAVHSSMPRH